MLTSITTETANHWAIPNRINIDRVGNEEVITELLAGQHDAQIRAEATGRYNCHGLTFGARRTCIDDVSSIQRILTDDGYRLVPPMDVMAGDIVVYYDDGVVTHSGIVVEVVTEGLRTCRVVSKWGVVGAEFLHWVHRSPYGGHYEFFRVDHSKELKILSKLIVFK
jgi:hypothetical protein